MFARAVVLLVFSVGLALATEEDVSGSPASCASVGGRCSHGCSTGLGGGGKWVFGKCTGVLACCVGGSTQPIPGKASATFFMANQAFNNGHPGALVYVPSKFDRKGPLNLVIFTHGFGNCVENAVRPVNNPIACSPGGKKCYSFGLIDQMEAANAQAILILPEVEYDQRSAEPGKLGVENGFQTFLSELLYLLTPIVGDKDTPDVNSIQLVSFSAGYWTTAMMATIGGVPAVREIVLLDSLYGEYSTFDNWIHQNITDYGVQPTQYRFANIYTADTRNATLAQISTVQGYWSQAGNKQPITNIDKPIVLKPADYVTPVLFKFTDLPQNEVPAHYFRGFVEAAYGRNLENLRKTTTSDIEMSGWLDDLQAEDPSSLFGEDDDDDDEDDLEILLN